MLPARGALLVRLGAARDPDVGFASADGPAVVDEFWNADGLLRDRSDADGPAAGAGPTVGGG